MAPSRTPIPTGQPIGSGGAWCSMGDFDGDGAPDLVSPSWSEAWIVFGDGAGHPGVSKLVWSGYNNGSAAADFDGDGRCDLALLGPHGVVHVLYGRADRTVDDVVAAPDSIGQQAQAIHVADLDGDGRPDIVLLTMSNPGRVEVFRNRGDRSFEHHPVSTGTGGEVRDVAVGDLTGDGVPDLVAYELTQFDLVPGLGNGGFGSSVSILPAAPYNYGGVAIGDVTGDGANDVVIAQAGGPLRVYPGHANGTLGVPALLPLLSTLRCFALADLDGDEWLDLVGYCQEGVGPRTCSATAVGIWAGPRWA